MSDDVRVFLALELGDGARRAASDVAQRLRAALGDDARSLRWTRPEGLHVTLRFFGEVESGRVPAIVEALGRALGGLPPHTGVLELGALQAFPERRPRVVALDLVPREPIVAIAAAAEKAAVGLGFRAETREFRPHVTLARVRQGGRFALPAVEPGGPAPFQAREVVLFRSQLGRGGSQYSPLERIALGGRHHPQRTRKVEDEDNGQKR